MVERQPGGGASQGIGSGDVQPRVKTAPNVPGVFDKPIAGGSVGEVGGENGRAHALSLNLGHDHFGLVTEPSTMHDHVGPCFGQLERHGAADA